MEGPGGLHAFELRMVEEEFLYGGKRIVVSPFLFPSRYVHQVTHQPICHNDIRAGRHQAGEGLQFPAHVVLLVRGIQNDQHRLAGPDQLVHAGGDHRGGRITLDQGNPVGERVTLDTVPVSGVHRQVDANNATLRQQLADGGMKQQGSSAIDAGLYDHVRLKLKQHLLEAN